MSFNKNYAYPLWDEMLHHGKSQLPKEARELYDFVKKDTVD
jgi:hypothetical protein